MSRPTFVKTAKRPKPLKGVGKKAQYSVQPMRTEKNKKRKLLKQIRLFPNDKQAKKLARERGFL